MSRTIPFRIPAVLVAIALFLAACGSAGDAAMPVEQGDAARLSDALDGAAGDGEPESPVSGAEDAGGAADGGDDAMFALIEERIVKTGEITLEVGNVGETLGRVRALVAELGGYVGGSQAGTLDDRAALTVRIPADRFDTALARLHELDAEVIAEATREEEVTSQVVDLAARIENLRASEASYRELLARAEKIEDILAVQSRLDGVRGEIEQLRAQLEALEDRAALSTLTVTLIPRPEPITQQAETWDPGAQLDRALASLVGIGQGLLDGAIWFVIVWLPILLILAITGLVLLRGVLEVRRRLPSSTDRTAA